MNMKQFRYVLVLAREGSFSRAAEALGISQPSLSQYVKKIEQEVGMPLFDRAGGDVRLTDAGRVYIDAGRRILDTERQMNAQLTDIAACKTGSVIIGTSPYRSGGMMPAVARRFQGMYPGMHIVVEEHGTGDLMDGLAHGAFDFCVTMLPVDERLFTYEKVMEEELLLAVPAAFPPMPAQTVPGRKYPAIDASQADGLGFIIITETQVMHKALSDICADYGIHIRTAAVVKSLSAQMAMVRAGVGVALLPSGIENLCAQGEVRFYSFKQCLPKREIAALWRRDQRLSQPARDLIAAMKDMQW